MKKVFGGLIILSLGITVLTRCTKENNNNAPALPPANSMQMDFSSFSTQKSASTGMPFEVTVDTTSSSNYVYAAIDVGIWRVIIASTLAIPVAAFTNSFNYQPVSIGNSTWQWSYNYNVLSGTYKARLTAQVETDSVKWEMYISKSGVNAFSEIKWFEGMSSINRTGGHWLLYYSVAHPDPFLQVNWTRSGDSINYVKYTNVREKLDSGSVNPAKGSFIEAGYQTGDNNAYYKMHIYNTNTTNFDDVSIEWSTTQYFGHVKSENYFKDTNWHCWDSSGKNMICTN